MVISLRGKGLNCLEYRCLKGEVSSRMLVVAGPSSTILARKTAERLGCRLVEVEFKRFPDGESYIRLKEDVKGERVAIIQSTHPPQDSHLIQLYLLVDACIRHGASEAIAVTPYLAYARQDKVFRPNEPVSIEAILRGLKCLGVKKLITVDVHSLEPLERVGLEYVNLSAVKILAEHFVEAGLRGAVAFAPDRKAAKLAEEAAGLLGGGYGWFTKHRDRVTGEVSSRLEHGEAEGRIAILFDDIISSGGTMRLAARTLKEAGALKVYAACTHSLMSEENHRKLLEAGIEEVVATDTVPGPLSKVSVASLLAEALKRFQ